MNRSLLITLRSQSPDPFVPQGSVMPPAANHDPCKHMPPGTSETGNQTHHHARAGTIKPKVPRAVSGASPVNGKVVCSAEISLQAAGRDFSQGETGVLHRAHRYSAQFTPPAPLTLASVSLHCTAQIFPTSLCSMSFSHAQKLRAIFTVWHVTAQSQEPSSRRCRGAYPDDYLTLSNLGPRAR